MNVTEIYSTSDIRLLRIAFGFFKILGLAPYKMVVTTKTLNNQLQLKFFYSLLGSIYNIILLFCFLITTIYAIHYLHTDNSNVSFDLQYEFDKISLGISNIICMFEIIVYVTQQKTMIKILTRLVRVEIELAKFYDPQQTQNEKYYQITVFMVHIIINIAIIPIEILRLSTINMWAIQVLVPEFFLGCLIMQYAIALNLLKKKFYKLNNTLLLPDHQTNFFTNTKYNNIINRNIIHIKKIRRLIYKITCELSNFYSLPIFLAITLFSVELIYDAYYAIITLNSMTMGTIDNILWITKDILPIIILTSSVTNIISEVS